MVILVVLDIIGNLNFLKIQGSVDRYVVVDIGRSLRSVVIKTGLTVTIYRE